MPETFIVANRKGGCGKTSTAVNISAYLAQSHDVLLIDLDPQAHATISFGIIPYGLTNSLYDVLIDRSTLQDTLQATSLPRLKVLPATRELAAAEMELANVRGREFFLRDRLVDLRGFDFVILDCPPSMGVLALNGLAAASRVLIPLQPHFLALEGLAQQMQTIYRVTNELNPALKLEGIIPTMVDGQTRLARSVIAEIAKNFGAEKVLPAIRNDVKVAEAPSFGQPLVEYAPNSRAASDYRQLADILLERYEPKENRARNGVRNPVQAL